MLRTGLVAVDDEGSSFDFDRVLTKLLPCHFFNYNILIHHQTVIIFFFKSGICLACISLRMNNGALIYRLENLCVAIKGRVKRCVKF